jgi:CubicO group peptidase (beta-lactamase class C family)
MDKTETQGFDKSQLDAIGGLLQGVVSQSDLSGVVAMVWRKGEIVRLDTVGKRDIANDLPMQRDTLFRIASMTKPITSVAAMMLMEEGKLALQDPITKWLPEFADMRVLKDPTGALDDTVESPRAITVEDLLTHRAGLAYGFTSTGALAKAHETALGSVLDSPHAPDDWLRRLASLPLTYAPGTQLHYSHATDVLGFLVGRVAGMDFREFLMQRIFAPLGMTDTDFHVPPSKRARQALLYQRDATTGRLHPFAMPAYDDPPTFAGGGGGLFSCLDDYLAFARMMLNKGELDGKRYLKRETVELMCTNHLTEAQRQVPFLGLPFWTGMGFGLGVSVVMDAQKHEWMGAGSKGSFGWPGAFGTWWQADPQLEMILIFLIQDYVPLTSDIAGRAVTGARVACPMWQKMVYGALTR